MAVRLMETKAPPFTIMLSEPVRSRLEAHLVQCASQLCSKGTAELTESIDGMSALYRQLLRERTCFCRTESVDPEIASVYWGFGCIKIGSEQDGRISTSAIICEHA